MKYLFAYGTLAAPNAPSEIAATVKRLKCVGEGFIHGRLYDLGEYPGAVLSRQPADKVFGKIFELPADPELLDRLDAYEGFEPQQPNKSLFIRKRTSIQRPNRDTLTGWVYEYNGNVRSEREIKNGQYSKLSADPR